MKHIYNTNFIDKSPKISYYVLGAFITDGCLYKRKNGNTYTFSLSSKDKDWIELIRDIISPTLPIRYRKNKNYYDIRGSNKYISNWLLNNNCVPRKSLILQMPSIPNEYIFDFLRGVIDGDGSILYAKKQNKYCISICSASKEFINNIQSVLQDNKINNSLYERKQKTDKIKNKIIHRNSSLYSVSINSKYAYKLSKLLYYNTTVPCLNRKYQTAIKIINHYESNNVTMNNVDSINMGSGEHNSNCKLSDNDVENILKKWLLFSADKKGSKSKFWRDYIKDHYTCSLSMCNFIIAGTFRKDIYSKIILNF